MQHIFQDNPELISRFHNSLSTPRFRRYLNAVQNDENEAINLYRWNVLASQALYSYLQAWEVCFRNKMNEFICWKYSESWPYDQVRALRSMKEEDRRRVTETIGRQGRARNLTRVPTSIIVADLSAGFWVSQLSKAYDVPYSWRYNLKRIFPHSTPKDAREAYATCQELLTLRNRVAHHEPVFHLELEELHSKLNATVAQMCHATSMFAEQTCSFGDVWANRPKLSPL